MILIRVCSDIQIFVVDAIDLDVATKMGVGLDCSGGLRVGLGLELHCCIVIVIRVRSDFRF